MAWVLPKIYKMDNKSFSWHKRLQSFRFAFDGIASFFKTQHNAIIHLFATVFAFAAAVFFDLSLMEWIVIILTCGLVWAAELFNTAIEAIMDHISRQQHPHIGYIKDVSAAAVLVTALAAISIGGIIFLPKIWNYVFA